MKIEKVEFHYLADDHIRDIGDGSQDALLVHVIMDDGATDGGNVKPRRWSPLRRGAARCPIWRVNR